MSITEKALAAALAALGASPKASIMPGAVPKWIPASVQVPDLSEVESAAFLADAVATLNSEAVSIPIDGGGFAGSEAHATAADRAIGWAHRGVIVDGQAYLEAEVLPEVAAAIDAGTLAFSSIDGVYERTEAGAYVPGSARLITHALTNTPRDRNLAPMQAVKAARAANGFTRARLAEGETMATKKPAEVKAAEEKAAEDPTKDPAKAAEMTIEEAMAKIAELEAKLAAMEAASAEMSAQLTESTKAAEEKSAEVKASEAEAACVAVVDEAIRCGQIAPASRDKFLGLARKSLETVKASIASIPKRTVSVVKAAESTRNTTSAPAALTEEEQHLAKGLRAGGMNEAAITAAIARKRGEK